MGQTFSVTKKNFTKIHCFTDKMYIKLNDLVDKKRAFLYETYFRDAMKPIFESKFNIPIYYCIFISGGYCIVARRISKSHLIEIRGIKYMDRERYTRFTKKYAKLVKNKVEHIE